ncbi:hypothetical protein B0H11DRAFT_452644 [Mycena galericulata]|nr:hypothetical protein B0H11DRAFT_452644 [Mycena galericulata]
MSNFTDAQDFGLRYSSGADLRVPASALVVHRSRALIACTNCRKRKIKCLPAGESPKTCLRCERKGLVCTYVGFDPGLSAGEEDWDASASDARREAVYLPGRSGTTEVDPLAVQRLSPTGRILDSWTYHGALQAANVAATMNGDFEKLDQILEHLRWEWLTVGGVLLGLAALETSVFTLSPQTVFNVDSFAQKVIAASSVATGFGIICDAWFLIRYYRLPSATFMTRSQDIYGSYLFFSLSARLPLLGTIIALGALMLFIGRIAFNTVPAFVIGLGLIFIIILGLQFLVKGTEITYSTISATASAVAGWASFFRVTSEGNVEGGTNFSAPAVSLPPEPSPSE